MSIKKTIAIACAGAGVVAGLVVTAPSAVAAGVSADSVAVDGGFAVWRDRDFQGPAGTFFDHTKSYAGFVYPGTSIPIDNSASSAANYAVSSSVLAFKDPFLFCDRTAPRLRFLPKGQVSAFESWFYADLGTRGYEDQISAHCFDG